MPTVVAAEGAMLERILDTTYVVLHQDLTRQAVAIMIRRRPEEGLLVRGLSEVP